MCFAACKNFGEKYPQNSYQNFIQFSKNKKIKIQSLIFPLFLTGLFTHKMIVFFKKGAKFFLEKVDQMSLQMQNELD